jgi:hypothetical protein
MKIIIETLDRTLPDGVITTIHWRGGDGPATIYGSVDLPPPSDHIIPYPEVTEETAMAWLLTQIDADALATKLAAMRDDIEHPHVAHGLPWQSAPETSDQQPDDAP